jgi:oligopeptide/dipeptide ABC transporter ATP-binding protein
MTTASGSRADQQLSTASGSLSVEGLRIAFGTGRNEHIAVHDVSLTVGRGEVVGLVGESGSGKSLTCRAIMGILPMGGRIVNGHIRFGEHDMRALSKRRLRSVHQHEIGMVFQDPFTSLNPTLRVGRQMIETLHVNSGLPRHRARDRAIELMTRVEIPQPEDKLRAYPHELSGGQRQRIMIALAIASNPQLLIADEPTTALDVSTQARVLSLLRELRAERQMSMLLVSHDFGVIATMCDRVVVMYGGFVVESGTTEEVYTAPQHPYTRALLAAIPTLDVAETGVRRPAIPGPPLGTVPYEGGCPFVPRCAFAQDGCSSIDMSLLPASGRDHRTACPFVTSIPGTPSAKVDAQ